MTVELMTVAGVKTEDGLATAFETEEGKSVVIDDTHGATFRMNVAAKQHVWVGMTIKVEPIGKGRGKKFTFKDI